jgi:hypothetical protein
MEPPISHTPCVFAMPERAATLSDSEACSARDEAGTGKEEGMGSA